MLSLFDLAAVLLTFSAVFRWFNSRYLPLPRSVGLLLISVLVSVMIVTAEIVFPTAFPFENLVNLLLRSTSRTSHEPNAGVPPLSGSAAYRCDEATAPGSPPGSRHPQLDRTSTASSQERRGRPSTPGSPCPGL